MAIYILKGTVSLHKGPQKKEIAKRGQGDLIGEMTLLLGDLPGVSAIAESAVEVYTVKHSALTESLIQDPKLCGKVFKMMAATLSERIGQASSKMRSEVVAKNTKRAEAHKKTAPSEVTPPPPLPPPPASPRPPRSARLAPPASLRPPRPTRRAARPRRAGDDPQRRQVPHPLRAAQDGGPRAAHHLPDAQGGQRAEGHQHAVR